MGNYKNKSKNELIEIINSINKTKDKYKDISNTEFQSILLSMYEMVVVFNEEQKVTYVNISDSNELFSDYKKIIGQKYQNVIPEYLQQYFDTAFKKNKKGKQSFYEYQLESNNEILHFSVRMSPIFDNDIFKGSVAIILNITKQKKAEETITTLTDRLQKSEEPLKFGFLDWDLITNNIYLSPEIYIIYGITDNVINAAEFINKFVHPDDIDFVNKNLTDAIKGGKNYNINHRIIRPDRKVVWLNNRAELIKDLNRKPIKLLGTIHKITDRMKMQEDIFKSESKYRILADNTFDWEYWIDPEGNYKYLSAACERITGYSQKEFIKNPHLLFDIVHSDFKEKIHKHYQHESIKESRKYKTEFQLTTKKGELRWIEHNCSPIYNNQGKFIGRKGNNRDVTDIKTAEYELKKQNEEYEALYEEYKITNEDLILAKNKIEESELKFRLMYENTPTGVVIISLDNKILSANKAYCEMLGFTEFELINKSLKDITHPETFVQNSDLQKKLGQELIPSYQLEKKFIQKDGNIVYGLLNATLIKNSAGKPVHFLGSVQNITQRKKAELELRTQNNEYALLNKEYKIINEELIIAKAKAEENEKLFKDILNTVPDPLSVTDMKTEKYIYINKGFEKITGYTEKEIIGKTVAEINIWKNYTERELFVKQLKKNGFIQNFESEFKMKSGSIVSGLISANVIYIQGVQNLLVITRDISKIKKTQKKLIISENKFRTIVHYSHAGICLINENAELTYVNKQFCQITGYNEDELINKSFVFLLDEKSKALVKKRYRQRQKGEIVEPNYEISVLCKNKEIKRIEMHSGIIKKADGTIQTLSQLLDITERKKAESELEKYREHLEILVKERTEKLESINQELIEANKDLGKFNELFINREFRIKELRNRVKELEEKL